MTRPVLYPSLYDDEKIVKRVKAVTNWRCFVYGVFSGNAGDHFAVERLHTATQNRQYTVFPILPVGLYRGVREALR